MSLEEHAATCRPEEPSEDDRTAYIQPDMSPGGHILGFARGDFDTPEGVVRHGAEIFAALLAGKSLKEHKLNAVFCLVAYVLRDKSKFKNVLAMCWPYATRAVIVPKQTLKESFVRGHPSEAIQRLLLDIGWDRIAACGSWKDVRRLAGRRISCRTARYLLRHVKWVWGRGKLSKLLTGIALAEYSSPYATTAVENVIRSAYWYRTSSITCRLSQRPPELVDSCFDDLRQRVHPAHKLLEMYKEKHDLLDKFMRDTGRTGPLSLSDVLSKYSKAINDIIREYNRQCLYYKLCVASSYVPLDLAPGMFNPLRPEMSGYFFGDGFSYYHYSPNWRRDAVRANRLGLLSALPVLDVSDETAYNGGAELREAIAACGVDAASFCVFLSRYYFDLSFHKVNTHILERIN